MNCNCSEIPKKKNTARLFRQEEDEINEEREKITKNQQKKNIVTICHV